MFIKVANWNFGQTSSKILVNFQKSCITFNIVVNYLLSIFCEFWLEFSLCHCSRASTFQNTSQWMLLFLLIPYPLKTLLLLFIFVDWSLFWRENCGLYGAFNCRTYIINKVKKVDAKSVTSCNSNQWLPLLLLLFTMLTLRIYLLPLFIIFFLFKNLQNIPNYNIYTWWLFLLIAILIFQTEGVGQEETQIWGKKLYLFQSPQISQQIKFLVNQLVQYWRY